MWSREQHPPRPNIEKVAPSGKNRFKRKSTLRGSMYGAHVQIAESVAPRGIGAGNPPRPMPQGRIVVRARCSVSFPTRARQLTP